MVILDIALAALMLPVFLVLLTTSRSVPETLLLRVGMSLVFGAFCTQVLYWMGNYSTEAALAAFFGGFVTAGSIIAVLVMNLSDPPMNILGLDRETARKRA